MTTVVNKKYDKFDHYCGRGSIFGNPFEIGRDGTREEVISKYEKWFRFLINDKVFFQELLKLKNKRLGCFCKEPNKFVACHCDIIADWVNEYFAELYKK